MRGCFAVSYLNVQHCSVAITSISFNTFNPLIVVSFILRNENHVLVMDSFCLFLCHIKTDEKN